MGSGSAAPATLKKSTRSQSQRELKKKTETTARLQTRKTSPAKKTLEPVSPSKKMTRSPSKEPVVVREETKKATKKEKSETGVSPIKSKRVVKQNAKSPKKVVEKSDTEEEEEEEESSDDEMKFKCEFCDRGFKRKYDMEKHSRKHTGDKPYKCGICGKQVRKFIVFKTTTNLSCSSDIEAYISKPFYRYTLDFVT